MYQVFLGLGSNIGDRLRYLTGAIEEISKISELRTLSSIYETSPVGMDTSNVFFNMVGEVGTSEYPRQLLNRLQEIEKKMGRKSKHLGADREIDIDILLYRGMSYEDDVVTVPHPRLQYRRFALEPFCEIAPTAVHPVLCKTIASLLRQCRDTHTVKRTEHNIDTMQFKT